MAIKSKKTVSFKIPPKSSLLKKIEESGGPTKDDALFMNGTTYMRCCWWVCDTSQCINPCQMVEACSKCWDTKTPT